MDHNTVFLFTRLWRLVIEQYSDKWGGPVLPSPHSFCPSFASAQFYPSKLDFVWFSSCIQKYTSCRWAVYPEKLIHMHIQYIRYKENAQVAMPKQHDYLNSIMLCSEIVVLWCRSRGKSLHSHLTNVHTRLLHFFNMIFFPLLDKFIFILATRQVLLQKQSSFFFSYCYSSKEKHRSCFREPPEELMLWVSNWIIRSLEGVCWLNNETHENTSLNSAWAREEYCIVSNSVICFKVLLLVSKLSALNLTSNVLYLVLV